MSNYSSTCTEIDICHKSKYKCKYMIMYWYIDKQHIGKSFTLIYVSITLHLYKYPINTKV